MIGDLSFNHFFKYGLAYAVVILIFFLGFTSYSWPYLNQSSPYFAMIIIYYWAVYRPNFIPNFLIFLMGIIYGLILNYPIGIHAIIFILANILIEKQRLFLMGQSYIVVWIGFGVSCLSLFIVEYLFFAMVSGQIINIEPLINNFILTLLFFPLVTLSFIFIHRALPDISKSVI